jgi:hypothetical protein
MSIKETPAFAISSGKPSRSPASSRRRTPSSTTIHLVTSCSRGCNAYSVRFRQARIAVSPLNPLPLKTTFHECAHVLLGHTTEGAQHDGEETPRSLRECEAEAVALLCCAALDLPGVDCARGYIQSWWGRGNPIPERSAQRILKAADQILKAGTTISTDGEDRA